MTRTLSRFAALLLVVAYCWSGSLAAQEATTTPDGTVQSGSAQAAGAAVDAPSTEPRRRGRRLNNDEGAVVTFAGDASLPAGESTGAVVAIIGSASSDGDVSESVVSLLGSTRVTGRVGESAVAILGNVFVDGVVDDQVVAIMGDVELGPNARIGDDVVVIGGALKRDPGAVIGGQVENVGSHLDLGDFGWLKAWIENCVFYLRPLAIAPGLGWAWTIAVGFLVFYVGLALLFRSTTERCLATLENAPGKSLLAALLGLLLTPLAFLLLLITVVGIAAIPFLATAVFAAGLFGKMVILSWLGRRGTKFFGDSPLNHPAVAVALGGAVVLGIYLVPVLGIIVYKLLGMLGLGVVLYTLLLAWQAAHPPVAAAATAVPDSGTAGASNSASPGPATGLDFEGPAAGVSPDPAVVTMNAANLESSSLPRAGFWIRIAALLIDAVLLAIILGVLGSHGPSFLLVLAAYGTVMWKLKSTTIGGSVCGLKVVRLDGRSIDWSTAIVRALGCFLSLAIAFLGFIWVVFDHEKQSWHDKIAGTTVVRVPKGVSLL
jgi:uncharacterized RDD family membrane protein YckC